MALGDLSTARVGNSVFDVDKAYILFHKKPIGGISDEEDIKNTDEPYENSFKNLGKKVANIGTELGAMSTGDRIQELKNPTDNNDGFVPVKVQYNPSTLRFTSREGQSYDRYSGVGGSGTFQIMNVPYEVVLSMDLIFDETVNSNAFASYDSSNIGSLSGLAQTIKTASLGSKNASSTSTENAGRRYSVQAISELFVAAIAHPYTRMISVVWNNTIFWGELTEATVEYSMFNREGDPIRSKVHVEIRKDERFDSETAAADWEKTYDSLFEAANKLVQKSVYSSTSVTEGTLGQQNGSTVEQGAKFIASNFFHI